MAYSFVCGGAGTVVTAVGNLISKRFRLKPNSPWIEFADVSKSIYLSAYSYLVPSCLGHFFLDTGQNDHGWCDEIADP